MAATQQEQRVAERLVGCYARPIPFRNEGAGRQVARDGVSFRSVRLRERNHLRLEGRKLVPRTTRRGDLCQSDSSVTRTLPTENLLEDADGLLRPTHLNDGLRRPPFEAGPKQPISDLSVR